MEADWSVELGADDPVIVVPWRSLPAAEGGPGFFEFVDLRARPQALDEIPEAKNRPALRAALAKLNGQDSGLWTAKCDAWIGSGDIDPWEMEATAEEAKVAAGSYIDVLALDLTARASFAIGEHWVRRLAARLRLRELHCARAEFVLRRAEIHGVAGFGVSWFVEGCGRTAELAERKWEEALAESLAAVLHESWAEPAPGTLPGRLE